MVKSSQQYIVWRHWRRRRWFTRIPLFNVITTYYVWRSRYICVTLYRKINTLRCWQPFREHIRRSARDRRGGFISQCTELQHEPTSTTKSTSCLLKWWWPFLKAASAVSAQLVDGFIHCLHIWTVLHAVNRAHRIWGKERKSRLARCNINGLCTIRVGALSTTENITFLNASTDGIPVRGQSC